MKILHVLKKPLSVLALFSMLAQMLFLGAVPALAAGAWSVDAARLDDTQCVSPAFQCKTIQAAVTAAGSGETINVAAGAYTENLTIDKPLTLLGVGDATIINGTVEATGDNVTIQSLKVTNSNPDGPFDWGIKATAGKTLSLATVTVDVMHNGVYMKSKDLTNVTTINISNSNITGYAAIELADPTSTYNDNNAAINVNINNTNLTGTTSYGGATNDYQAIGMDYTNNITINFTGTCTVTNEYTVGATSRERLIWFWYSNNNSITGTPTYINHANSTVSSDALFMSSNDDNNTVAGQAVARYVMGVTEFEAALASFATTPIVVGGENDAFITTQNNTLKTGVTLRIEANTPVTIDAGDTLTNNGTIVIEPGATFTNSGLINGSGTISGTVAGSGIILCVNAGGTNGCFFSIQSAISAASASDTINIAAGTYTENLTIDKSLTLLGVGDTTILNGAIVSGGSTVVIQNLKIITPGLVNYDDWYFGVRATANHTLTLNNVTIDVSGTDIDYYGIRMGFEESSTSAVINIINSRIKGYAAIYLNGSTEGGTIVQTGTHINVTDSTLTGTTQFSGDSSDFAVIAIDNTTGVNVDFTGASSVVNEYTDGAQAKERLIRFRNASGTIVTGAPTYTNGVGSTVNANALFMSYGSGVNTVNGQVVARWITNVTEFESALASSTTTPIVVGRYEAPIVTTGNNTLKTGVTLIVEDHAQVTIDAGDTFTNNGTIVIETGATFINNGIIGGSGAISGIVVNNGTIDNTAPTGSVLINNDAAWTNAKTNFTLTLDATDVLSGVAKVWIANDPGNYWGPYDYAQGPYNWSLSTKEGANNIYVKYVDAAGNESPVYSDTIMVDTIAPAITNPITITPSVVIGSSRYISGLSTITMRADDTGVGINPTSCRYSVDGGTTFISVPTAYGTELGYVRCVFPNVDTSEATVIVTSVDDYVGNSAPSTPISVSVDNTPPNYSWVAPAVDSVYVDGQAVYIEADIIETGSGIVDGASCIPAIDSFAASFTGSVTYSATTHKCTGTIIPMDPSGLGDGTHHITLSVADRVGNSVISADRNILVDNTKPTIGSIQNNGIWWNTNFYFILAPVDWSTSGKHSAQYRLDSGDWQNLDESALTPGPWWYGAWITTEGVHTLDYNLTDNAGNSNAGTVTVMLDKTAPTVPELLSPVDDFHMQSSSVDFDWSDSVDHANPVNYEISWSQDSTFTTDVSMDTPTSSEMSMTDFFTEGVWYWRVRSKDSVGNYSDYSDMFQFTVDWTEPVISRPDDFTAEADTLGGAGVEYVVSATDNVDDSVAVTCSPLSDAVFLLGETTVDCTSTDSSNNTSNVSFKVTVVDTTKPIIASHENIVVDATSSAGSVVAYTKPIATDIADGTDTVTCLLASGATFPIGVTTVRCKATDSSDNTAVETSFTVTVNPLPVVPLVAAVTTATIPSTGGETPGEDVQGVTTGETTTPQEEVTVPEVKGTEDTAVVDVIPWWNNKVLGVAIWLWLLILAGALGGGWWYLAMRRRNRG